MGYISNNNLSTTQLHLPFTHCDINGTDEQHHQVITASSGELGDGKNNFPVTSRWNPTPEQIMTLEELYRSGTRTPTTEEIKEIAFKLRKFGRIEGKNVFYWFQNHKARDRQKRRRREGDAINNVHQPQNDFKDSSGGHRVDQTKSCLSIPHSKSKHQPQYELVTVNHEKDNNIIYEDHGTTEESERASEDGKDATWRSLVTWSVTQEQGEINIINENEYNVLKQEKEGTREIRTLNLFPVMESQEKTDRFTENKMHTKANQVLGCNCCYYYEFMPLKN